MSLTTAWFLKQIALLYALEKRDLLEKPGRGQRH